MTPNFDDLCFLICWWNDSGIFRTLESIPKDSQKIIIDGKFKDTKSPNLLSPQTLRDKLLRYPNVTLIDVGDVTEVQKRSKYLEAAKGHKYGFIIDSDEYLSTCAWPKFFQIMTGTKYGFKHVCIQSPTNKNEFQTFPRVIVNPSDWEYHNAHFMFRNKSNGEIAKNLQTKDDFIDESIVTISQDDTLRFPEYCQLLKEYQEILMHKEERFRVAYRTNTVN
jgi:hypothetical protein